MREVSATTGHSSSGATGMSKCQSHSRRRSFACSGGHGCSASSSASVIGRSCVSPEAIDLAPLIAELPAEHVLADPVDLLVSDTEGARVVLDGAVHGVH